MPHNCTGDLPSKPYGEAITDCNEDSDNKLWAGNGEYSSQVNYCPYCGFKALAQVELGHDRPS